MGVNCHIRTGIKGKLEVKSKLGVKGKLGIVQSASAMTRYDDLPESPSLSAILQATFSALRTQPQAGQRNAQIALRFDHA